jgi:hypothetical protein
MTPPPDPSTPLSEAGSSLRELFETLVASGFTEWQACRILGVMVAEQGRQS